MKSKSFFLFGARATGKSTLLKSLFSEKEALWFDLLDLELEAEFQTRPQSLLERIEPYRKQKEKKWIIIDEIQKVPEILDLIHLEIEKKTLSICTNGLKRSKTQAGIGKSPCWTSPSELLVPTHSD